MAEPKPAKPVSQALRDNAPWKPPHWELADAKALQLLEKGTASPEMQQRALAYIVNVLCGTYELSYRPGAGDGERDTALAEGRRFVGLQVVKLLKTDLSKFRRNE